MSTYTLTPATLARLLRDLDDEGVAAFLADLRAESGWEVERDGATVIATRPSSGDTERLRAVSDDRSRVARLLNRPLDEPEGVGVDTYVVGATDGSILRLADDETTDVLDAEDLFTQLLYSVDRAACQELCARHFDVSADPKPPSDRSETGYMALLTEALSRLTGDRRRVAAIALVGVLLFATTAYGILALGDDELRPGGGTLPGSGSEDVTPVGMGAGQDLGETEPTPTVPPRELPRDFPVTLADTYYFPTGEAAAESFVYRLRASQEQSNVTYAVEAMRIFLPEHRPNLSTLQAKMGGGEYARLADFDEISVGQVPGLPPLTDSETVDRGYLSVTRENFQTIYGFTAVCRNETPPDAEGCWQLRAVYMLNSDDRPTPADWGTPTPTPVSVNLTRTVTSTDTTNGT